MIYIKLCAILFFVAFSGCNITYHVRNQSNEIEEIVYFPCGKVTVELVGRGNSKFEFNQKFELDASITMYTDSLKVFFNGEEIKTEFSVKDQNGADGLIKISDTEQLKASFEFEKGVFEGDTIKICGPEIIRCKDQVVTLDTLIYIFVNNLRIYGVNEF